MDSLRHAAVICHSLGLSFVTLTACACVDVAPVAETAAVVDLLVQLILSFSCSGMMPPVLPPACTLPAMVDVLRGYVPATVNLR